ncbi:MAG: hypothetical protein A2086_07870 [Spirochaetes bacterium GWD1_27_9]|nr:MAG: hypothetical protein A2Z98_12380 [Spirochaetes bacterium GWB1_27_13]OHD46003.1 MAG: hypothetical protein A2086_07870 [Spirochaetes bacterium GWD1_27_9]
MKRFLFVFMFVLANFYAFSDVSADILKKQGKELLNFIKNKDSEGLKSFLLNDFYLKHDVSKDSNTSLYDRSYLLGSLSGFFAFIEKGQYSAEFKELKNDTILNRIFNICLSSYDFYKKENIEANYYKKIKKEIKELQKEYPKSEFVSSFSLILKFLNTKIKTSPSISVDSFKIYKKLGYCEVLFSIENNTDSPITFLYPDKEIFLSDGFNQLSTFDEDITPIRVMPNLSYSVFLKFPLIIAKGQYQLLISTIDNKIFVSKDIFYLDNSLSINDMSPCF